MNKFADDEIMEFVKNIYQLIMEEDGSSTVKQAKRANWIPGVQIVQDIAKTAVKQVLQHLLFVSKSDFFDAKYQEEDDMPQDKICWGDEDEKDIDADTGVPKCRTRLLLADGSDARSEPMRHYVSFRDMEHVILEIARKIADNFYSNGAESGVVMK